MKVLAPGLVVEGQKLVEKIGDGGYGEVWKAEYLGAPVALKFFRTDGLRHVREEAVAQYQLGRLKNPDAKFFPRVEHVNLECDTPYMRLEFIDGTDVQGHLQAHSDASITERLTLANRILEALAAVHRNEFVHGDLSPSNVLIGPDGSVRLIDVGVGVAYQRPEMKASGSSDRPLGVAAPMYASPERFTKDFKDCGRQADVFSFGKLFYHVMTGEDPVAVKPLTKRFPELKGAWDEFMYACLESAPEKRYPSAVEALQAFQRIQEGSCAQFAATCVTCSARTQVLESALGKIIACQKCGQKMEVEFLDFDSGDAHVRQAGPVAGIEILDSPALPSGPAASAPRSSVPDFTRQALLAFSLYFLFWLPGAVATTVFLFQARRIQRCSGIKPAGADLLEAFSWMFIYIPLLGLLGFCLLRAAVH